KYIALSHCRGGTIGEADETTRSNNEDRKSKIVISALPRNFVHAVHVTRRFGVRYLWIDTLCIIQDSADDWQTELLKMG
ncbi:hypothetical protein BJ170DRAFT_588982, partial [Xylariales sp. AK1849]